MYRRTGAILKRTYMQYAYHIVIIIFFFNDTKSKIELTIDIIL